VICPLRLRDPKGDLCIKNPISLRLVIELFFAEGKQVMFRIGRTLSQKGYWVKLVKNSEGLIDTIFRERDNEHFYLWHWQHR
jgi:hypothetical protein